jgi:hypothetical protein
MSTHGRQEKEWVPRALSLDHTLLYCKHINMPQSEGIWHEIPEHLHWPRNFFTNVFFGDTKQANCCQKFGALVTWQPKKPEYVPSKK